MMLYIDPGTGSMLFTVLIGLLGTALYLLRKVFVKLRFLIGGGVDRRGSNDEHVPYAVFSDHKRYWNTFEPICDEFEKRSLPLVFLTASPDDPSLEKSYQYVQCRYIGEGNHAFAKLNLLKADILLSTTPGLDVYQWKRSKDVKWYVHVLHMANDPTSYRMFGLDYYDALLFSGDYQIKQARKLEAMRGLPAKDIQLVGVPYLDKMLLRLETEFTPQEHSTTILLAPSWGESSLLSRYGERIIKATLSTGYHVIVRPHPQSFISEKDLIDRLMIDFPESDCLEWNRDNDNFDVLRRSDLMISDFSGVIFDFCLVFHKPVIYADTSFDKSPYDAWWLDEEMWTFQTLPKIGRQLKEKDLGKLRELIDEMLDNHSYIDAIDRACDEAWVHRGQAASLIVDYMTKKEKELTEQTWE